MSQTVKRILFVLFPWALSLIMVAVFSSCTGPEGKPVSRATGVEGKIQGKGRHVFGATYMTMVNPFFTVVDDGIREIVEAQGDKLISYDPGNDQLKQIDQIRDFIDMKVDAIFLNPVDWHFIKPALEAAKKAKIPVINVDAPVYDLDLINCLVATDNVKAGIILAEDLRKNRDHARIAIIDHISAKSAIDRTEGFVQTLGNSGNYNVVARYSSDGNIEQALVGMETILRTVGRVDVVFATNDPSAMGAIAALEAASHVGTVLVYGIDGAPYAKKMIAEGKMHATAAQSPVMIGRTAAEIAYRILRGEKVEKVVLIPPFLINASNVQRYGINGWQ